MTKASLAGSGKVLNAEWFFTSPYDPSIVRRGDPLGLRLIAARYADTLAPGLSNRTIDARWLTLTAWMLVQANNVWRRRGNSVSGPLSRPAARDLFDWLEPMELLCVARTLSLDESKGRQLPGQRAVRRWLENGKSSRRFGMSFAQYRRQRSIGVYGAYRVALRALPGMTINGDGWRPDRIAGLLSSVAQKRLGSAAASSGADQGKFEAETYWQQRGWPKWESTGGKDFIPETLGNLRPITSDEIDILGPALFGAGESKSLSNIRRSVVEVMSSSRVDEHHELCRALEKDLLKPTAGAVSRLGVFAQLADKGMTMMNAIWSALQNAQGAAVPALSAMDLARMSDVKDAARELISASKEWLAAKTESRSEWGIADELATLVNSQARDLNRLVTRLIEYHELRGGGRRWFRLDDKRLVRPVSSLRDQEGSPYRFRLFSLARLAVQCKVITKIPPALDFRDVDEEGRE
jgi:hypothetical protein